MKRKRHTEEPNHCHPERARGGHAAALPGKLDNIGCETLLVVTTARDLVLRRAMLPERRTGATLGKHAAALGPAWSIG